MKFLIRHKEWFKGMSIASFVSLNFFRIASCWTGEDGAWAATFMIAAIAIVSSLIAQFTQDFASEEKVNRKETTDTTTASTNGNEL